MLKATQIKKQQVIASFAQREKGFYEGHLEVNKSPRLLL